MTRSPGRSVAVRRTQALWRRRCRELARLDLSTPLEQVRFAVIDLETTGLDPRRHAVLSIGGVRVRAGRVHLRDRFFTDVRPDRPIPAATIRIHGIPPDRAAEAPPPEAALAAFLTWCGADVLVGHHVALDRAFLDRALRRWLGVSLLNPAVDVVALGRALFYAARPPRLRPLAAPGLALEALASRLNVPVDGRHTALGDALTTAGVFIALLGSLGGRGMRTLADLLAVAGTGPPLWRLRVRLVRGLSATRRAFGGE